MADTTEWRMKKTVSERNSNLLNNKLYSDVTFVVGEKKEVIPAHKIILASASDVFHSMFYGEIREKDQIELPDVDPDAFIALLQYIYTDEIRVDDHTIQALYVSKKYMVNPFLNACREKFLSNLDAQNAIYLFAYARLFDEQDLESECLVKIDYHAKESLKSQCFTQLDQEAVKFIIQRDSLNCDELTIFEAVEAWAVAQCSRNNREKGSITEKEKREVIGDMLHLIRFTNMELQEFADGPALKDLLTERERLDLFLYFNSKHKPALPFPNKPRLLKPQTCRRFYQLPLESWSIGKSLDAIQFHVDREIKISGYGIYGNSTSAHYSVTLELLEVKGTFYTVLASAKRTKSHNGIDEEIDFLFDKAIRIQPDKKYIASVQSEVIGTTRGGTGGQSKVVVDCHGCQVKFIFENTSLSTNGTNVNGGQLPNIFFLIT